MPGRELMLHPMAGQRLTLAALATAAHCHPDLVEKLVVYGLLEPLDPTDLVIGFETRAVIRLRTICRLRQDLGINLPGIAVVLDLLERIEALQRHLGHGS